MIPTLNFSRIIGTKKDEFTDAEIERISREWERLMIIFYSLGYRSFRRALQASIQPVLQSIQQSQSIAFTQSIANMLVTEIPIASAMQEFVMRISTDVERNLFRLYTSKLPESARIGVGIGDPRYYLDMQNYINTVGADHVREITETTRAKVNKALQDGLDNKETLRQVGKRIEKYTLGSTTELKRSRALLIARTETLMATAQAKELHVSKYPVIMEKVWVHDHPKVSRDIHLNLNLKRVDFNEKFNVGGTMMKYPGDPAGGAGNNCNCRCSYVCVPKLRRGQVIFKN